MLNRMRPQAATGSAGRGLRRGSLWGTAVLAVVIVCGTRPPAGPAPAFAEPPPPQPAAGAAKAVAPAAPMTEPLRLIAQARAAIARVNDYTCILVKRERLDGRLSPNHVVAMKVKQRPFSVYLRWREPRDLAGQEVCYVEGRNDGEMRVHPTGLLSALGWVSLSPDDPRARKSSRHRITDAGLGNLIERFGRGWELENQLRQTQVRIGTYEFNKSRCTRVETIHTGTAGGRLPHYRNVVYFDNQTHLPVRVECYDWSNQPEEIFSYVNIRLNVGLRDADFVR